MVLTPSASIDFTAVEIEINHHCNRACSYCPNSILKRKNTGEIDPEIYLKLMRELRDQGFSGRISYDFYNEPMLHSNFDEIVGMTREHLPTSPIVLYTNGTLLTRERFSRLVERGISEFIVTRHEADIGKDRYVFDQVYQDLNEADKKRVRYRDYSTIRLSNRGGTLKHLGEDGLPLRPCYVPTHVVTVTVSGNILPCFEDFHEEMVMGNLRENSISEIWNSEKYRQMRKELRAGVRHTRGPCKTCNKRDVLPPFN
ncbi:MAG: SPASM domain-containing protein [Bdellovibrionota bacterium]